MKRILAAVAMLGMITALTACEQQAAPIPVPQAEQADEAPRSGGRLGMTYGGRLGVELAPGLVMGFDGSIGLGFGF